MANDALDRRRPRQIRASEVRRGHVGSREVEYRFRSVVPGWTNMSFSKDKVRLVLQLDTSNLSFPLYNMYQYMACMIIGFTGIPMHRSTHV